jgi:hypothetical protein
MFKEVKSEADFCSYCSSISIECWRDIVVDKSFAKVNPDNYEDFDLKKYPDGLVPLYEYVNDWININDLLWQLDNGDVVLLMWEED